MALLPVGAIEQHGPHLPLDTDAFDADYLARAGGRRLQRPQAAGAAADPLRRLLPPRGLRRHPFGAQRDPGPAGLRRRHERRPLRHHQAGHHQRPRRQRPGPALRRPDDQPRRPHLHLRRHRRDQRRRHRRAWPRPPTTCTPARSRPAPRWPCARSWCTWTRRRAVGAQLLQPLPRLHHPARRRTGTPTPRRISPSGVMGDPTKATAEKGAACGR